MATRAKARRKPKAKRKLGKGSRKSAGRKRKLIRKKVAKKTLPKKVNSSAKAAAKPKPVSKRLGGAVKPQPSSVQPVTSEGRIGVVTHYYSHLSVATMRLAPGATLRVGDVIHIRGHTTDFTQRVESLEVDHASVDEVGPNDDFGLKVVDHAREHDIVFKARL